MDTYNLIASPTLSSGQTVRARVSADTKNATPIVCGLYLNMYGAGDQVVRVDGPAVSHAAGAEHEFVWRVPPLHGLPICAVGVALAAERRADGSVYLDTLTWDGEPEVTLTRPAAGGERWRQAWVNGVDQWDERWPEAFRIVQNEGTGLLIHGTREWRDYTVSAAITPYLAASVGTAARVQGMRRYYALLLVPGGVRLIKALDGETMWRRCLQSFRRAATHVSPMAQLPSLPDEAQRHGQTQGYYVSRPVKQPLHRNALSAPLARILQPTPLRAARAGQDSGAGWRSPQEAQSPRTRQRGRGWFGAHAHLGRRRERWLARSLEQLRRGTSGSASRSAQRRMK